MVGKLYEGAVGDLWFINYAAFDIWLEWQLLGAVILLYLENIVDSHEDSMFIFMGEDALLLLAVGGWVDTTVQEQKIFDFVGFGEDGIAVCSSLK